MNLKTKIGVSVWILLLAACIQEPAFEYQQMHTFPDETWHRGDTVIFHYTPTKSGRKNIYFYLENTNAYPYSNLFMIVKTRHNDQITVDTLEYKMADGYGRWLGRKVRNNIENLLVFKTGVPAEQGDSIVIIPEFATRRIDRTEGDEKLSGISRLGIIVEHIASNSPENGKTEK